jgi:GT2 family glycosyltransferase
MAKVELSIIIVNYNTKEELLTCLKSIYDLKYEVSFEVIVSDNGSSDGSIEMVRREFPQVLLLENKENLGFAKGNNQAKKYAKAENILFLNSDTILHKGSLKQPLEYLKNQGGVGAVTCKVVLKNGKLDLDTRRSFPTPWVAFAHFLYFDRLFPKSTIFAKYWYGYIPDTKMHQIDVLQGAYCLVRKEILDKVGWFDESYFLDGEDIDLCWKIYQLGYKIMYFPKVSITHIKKASKKKNRNDSVLSGMKAMETFYRKHLWSKYPLIVNYTVIGGIEILKKIRLAKTFLST